MTSQWWVSSKFCDYNPGRMPHHLLSRQFYVSRFVRSLRHFHGYQKLFFQTWSLLLFHCFCKLLSLSFRTVFQFHEFSWCQHQTRHPGIIPWTTSSPWSQQPKPFSRFSRGPIISCSPLHFRFGFQMSHSFNSAPSRVLRESSSHFILSRKATQFSKFLLVMRTKTASMRQLEKAAS